MRELRTSALYRRDVRRLARRRKDLDQLRSIINSLVAGEPLPARCHPHRLVGNWHTCWECHIEHDWLLVWEDDGATITLRRTGTHSDIFGG